MLYLSSECLIGTVSREIYFVSNPVLYLDELDELWIIQEAEVVIDRSFWDVVPPKNEDRWVTVRGAGRKQSVRGSPVVVPLSNKYSALYTVEGERHTGGEPQ